MPNPTRAPDVPDADMGLARAVRSFQNADIEFLRAGRSVDPERINKAGSRYAVAKFRMFQALRARAAGA